MANYKCAGLSSSCPYKEKGRTALPPSCSSSCPSPKKCKRKGQGKKCQVCECERQCAGIGTAPGSQIIYTVVDASNSGAGYLFVSLNKEDCYDYINEHSSDFGMNEGNWISSACVGSVRVVGPDEEELAEVMEAINEADRESAEELGASYVGMEEEDKGSENDE